MTPDSDDRDRLRGLARSIDRLFSDAEPRTDPEREDGGGEEGALAVEPDETPAPGQVDEPTLDAFWEMDEISPDAGRVVDESHDAELDIQEFDAADLDAPELDDAEVAASGLGGDDFDLSDLDRVDYDGADFDSDFDEAEWAELLAEPPEAGAGGETSADFPEADEAAGSATLFERAVETYLAGSENPIGARTRVQHYAEALLEDGDVDDVADGVERLGGAGGDAAEVAREILASPVAHVLAGRLASFTGEDERRERIELAVRLGYDFAPALSEVLAETENKVARYAVVDALVAMGVDGWDAVVEMVGDERWWVVRNAVLVLGRTGGEESVRFLTRTIEHEDPRVRLEAVRALEEIGGVKAGDRIQSRLDDEAPRVRAAAVRAVGTLQIEGARERLRTMLEQESDEIVEVAVIETLGGMGDAHSIARFEKKLEGSFFRKPTTEIRAAVYGAFGAIGTPRTLELLRAASEEKDPVTRTLARRVLRDRAGGGEDEGAR